MLLLIVRYLSGCIAWDPILRYAGEHSELIATAIHSIPGVESSADDSLIVLEEDPYGRVLFAVCLTRTFLIADSWNNCVAAVLIMQKYDNDFVYFYPEQNYQLVILTSRIAMTKDDVNSLFADNIISDLKEANSWNLPPFEKDPQLIFMPNAVEKSTQLSNASKKLIEQYVGTNIRYSFFRENNSGNQLYFILHVAAPSTYEWYVVAFKSDGTLCEGENGILKLCKSDLNSIPVSIEYLFSCSS